MSLGPGVVCRAALTIGLPVAVCALRGWCLHLQEVLSSRALWPSPLSLGRARHCYSRLPRPPWSPGFESAEVTDVPLVSAFMWFLLQSSPIWSPCLNSSLVGVGR